MGIETDTVDETRKAARLQLREGADFVKLMATGGMGTKGSVPNAPQLTEAQMPGRRGGGRQRRQVHGGPLHRSGRCHERHPGGGEYH